MSLWFEIACQFILIDHKIENMPKHTFHKHFHTNSLSTLQSKCYLDKGSKSTSLLGLAVCLHRLQTTEHLFMLGRAPARSYLFLIEPWLCRALKRAQQVAFPAPNTQSNIYGRTEGKGKKGSAQKAEETSPHPPSPLCLSCWSGTTTKMDSTTGLQSLPVLTNRDPT